MASTYSTNLALELMGTGDQAGTWGTTTNTNLGTLIEQSISGVVTQAITDGSGANTTITIPNGTTGVARNMYIEMTGALTFGTTSLIVPTNKKLYFIFNNTTGGFAVTVKVTGQTGVSVPNGAKMILVMNSAGTDVVSAVSYFASLTLGSALGVASGGTGSTTLTTNNVLLGNGTSALQVVAPGTNGNILTSNGTTWSSTAPTAAGVTSFSAGTTGFTPSTGTTGVVTLAGTLIAANGGTGLTSPGANGNVLTSNGSAWTSAASTSNYIGDQGQRFTANGTFTIPTGVTAIKVTVVAGGGAGATGTQGLCCIPGATGGGGGAGGAAIKYLTGLTPGNTIAVTVGGAGSSSQVASGTQTITTVSATAGSAASTVTTGGAGGVGSSGDLNIGGGGGNGGQSWGILSATSTAASGGSGGSSILGGGGRSLPGVGGAGQLYGGGGAGGGGGANAGGAGAAGVVIFEW